MHESLIEMLDSFKTLTESERNFVVERFQPLEFQKGDFLVQEGQVCEQLLFITEGYFRVYVLKDIDENTVHLAGANDFVSAYSSFISRSPSFEYVQAVTDAKGLAISSEDLETLYRNSPKIERVGRLILESLFVKKENRVIDFIKHTSQERYNKLLEVNPEIIFNVPLQYIASYLGVKPETLSRIRAKK